MTCEAPWKALLTRAAVGGSGDFLQLMRWLNNSASIGRHELLICDFITS